MASLSDNIKTIQTAVYGKEMRPAISEAIAQNWEYVKSMMESVDRLNARIDSLPNDSGNGGGSTNPEHPDEPSVSNTCGITSVVCMAVDAILTTTAQYIDQTILI